MEVPLRSLPVLIVDCQASGATPAYGDLLEIAWATCDGTGLASPVRATWVVPGSDRPVPRAVRKLTGWDESCLEGAIPAGEAWRRLRTDAVSIASGTSGAAGASGSRAPTAIHYARFELGFLTSLHEDGGALPLDVACVHAIARRLHPELPRRSLRALAGYLGFAPGTTRSAAAHVEATAFVWSVFTRELEARGVASWPALRAWLEEPAPRPPRKRTFPLAPEKRRALPDAPGVYRFVRRSGDVLYVGKATSLKKRVASHFTSAARATERALEMLTQVDGVEVSRTETALEAALLECDEIKRLDPPYNVHLKAGTRRTWFASRDLSDVTMAPDDAHPLGPLPGARSAAPIAALRRLLGGAPELGADVDLRAQALGIPPAFAPDEAVFSAGLAALLPSLSPVPITLHGWLRAARALGTSDDGDGAGDADDGAPPPFTWTPEAVRDQLSRALANAGGAVERARRIRLLASAKVTFHEAGRAAPRTLVLDRGELVATLDGPDDGSPPPARRGACAFEVARYDRLRVLATELARVAATPGARVEVRIRSHRWVLSSVLT